MAKVSPFDVLKEMGKRNLDIKVLPLWDNLRDVRVVGKNGVITMFVDPDTANNIMYEYPMVAFLIVADGKQFDRLKTELENR